MSIASKNIVKNQYATSARLKTRISIHEKYRPAYPSLLSQLDRSIYCAL